MTSPPKTPLLKAIGSLGLPLGGYRLVDILKEQGQTLTLDLDKFHDIEPTQAIPGFPYPERSSAL